MNFETLGESLRMAIDEAFVLEPVEQKTLQESIQGVSKTVLDAQLERINGEQQPGLKRLVADAYCGADKDLIEMRRQQAQCQARNGVIRQAAKVALIATNNHRKRSTIGRKRGRYTL